MSKNLLRSHNVAFRSQTGLTGHLASFATIMTHPTINLTILHMLSVMAECSGHLAT
jgi:hypothetical protein